MLYMIHQINLKINLHNERWLKIITIYNVFQHYQPYMKDKLALFFLSTKQCKDHESQNETVDVFHQVENKQAIIGRHRNL